MLAPPLSLLISGDDVMSAMESASTSSSGSVKSHLSLNYNEKINRKYKHVRLLYLP